MDNEFMKLSDISRLCWYIKAQNEQKLQSKEIIKNVLPLNEVERRQQVATIKRVLESLSMTSAFRGIWKNEKVSINSLTLKSSLSSPIIISLLQVMVSFSRFYDGKVKEFFDFYDFQKNYVVSSTNSKNENIVGEKKERYMLNEGDYLKEWILIDTLFSAIDLLNDSSVSGQQKGMKESMEELARKFNVTLEFNTVKNDDMELTYKQYSPRTLSLKQLNYMKKIVVQWWFPKPTKQVIKNLHDDFHLGLNRDEIQNAFNRYMRRQTEIQLTGVYPKDLRFNSPEEELLNTFDAIRTLGSHFLPEIPDGYKLTHSEEIVHILQQHFE